MADHSSGIHDAQSEGPTDAPSSPPHVGTNTSTIQTPEQTRQEIIALKTTQMTAKRLITRKISRATKFINEYLTLEEGSALQSRAAASIAREIAFIDEEMAKLSTSTISHVNLLVGHMTKNPAVSTKCNERITELEEADEEYLVAYTEFTTKFSAVIDSALALSKSANSQTSDGTGSASSSRPTSPSFTPFRHSTPTPQFKNSEHLKPSELVQDCGYADGIRWQEDLQTWGDNVYAAFENISNEMWFNLIKATVDTFWLQRLKDQGYNKDKPKSFAMQLITNQLQISFPLHRRRTEFLVLKQAKGESPREYFYNLLRSASQAEASGLNPLNLVMHLFANHCSDAKARELCLKHLHEKPEGVQAVFETELSKLESLEGLKGQNQHPLPVRQAQKGKGPSTPCPICQKPGHWRRNCTLPCTYCGRTGSHRSQDCSLKPHGNDGYSNRGRGGQSRGRGGNPRNRPQGRGRGSGSNSGGHTGHRAGNEQPPPAAPEQPDNEQQHPPEVNHSSNRASISNPGSTETRISASMSQHHLPAVDSFDDSFYDDSDSWTTTPASHTGFRVCFKAAAPTNQNTDALPEDELPSVAPAEQEYVELDIPELVDSDHSGDEGETSDEESVYDDNEPRSPLYSSFSDISFSESYTETHFQIQSSSGLDANGYHDFLEAIRQDDTSSTHEDEGIISAPLPSFGSFLHSEQPMHCSSCCATVWVHSASECPRHSGPHPNCAGHHQHASLAHEVDYPELPPRHVPNIVIPPRPATAVDDQDQEVPDHPPSAPTSPPSSNPRVDPQDSVRNPNTTQQQHTVRKNLLDKLSPDNVRASAAQLSRQRHSGDILQSKGSHRPDVASFISKVQRDAKQQPATVIFDTGCSISLLDKRLAEAAGLDIIPHSIPGEVKDAQGGTIQILGRTKFLARMKNFNFQPKTVEALVVLSSSPNPECLIDLDYMVQWRVVPPDFPNPMPYSAKYLQHCSTYPENDLTPSSSLFIGDKKIKRVRRVKTAPPPECVALQKELMEEFSDIFKTELGPQDRLNVPPVKLQFKEGVEIRPVNHSTARETPLHLQSASMNELNSMISAGVLEPVTWPTDWATRGFFVRKPGPGPIRCRLVSDFRILNDFLLRPRVPFEGSSLLMKRLKPDAKYYLCSDLTSGYHQLNLDPSDRDKLCIILPSGKYRYTVTPQGLSPSGDFFNILTSLDIHNYPGLHDSIYKNIDDVMLAADSIDDLRSKARWFFSLCRKKNMKLNPRKLQISNSVLFGGTVISSEKIHGKHYTHLDPSDESVDTILNLPSPSSKRDVQCLLGLCNQMARWYPQLNLITPNLRKLTSPNIPFSWNADLEKEFNQLKESLRQYVRISPLDIKKPIHAFVDASSTNGVGYIIIQYYDEDHPEKGACVVKANSTSFSPSQLKYSIIEQELLGLSFLFKDSGYFLQYADRVIVHSDNRALCSLVYKPLADIMNPRVVRILEKLRLFNIDMRWIPGSENVAADCLSRLSKPTQECPEVPLCIPIVSHVSRKASLEPDLLDPYLLEIAERAKMDPSYMQSLDLLKSGTPTKNFPADCELKSIESTVSDLSVVALPSGDELIVKDGHVVLIPPLVRPELLKKLHFSHGAAQTMIDDARGKFFWPSIRNDIIKTYSDCPECVMNQRSKIKKTCEVRHPDLTLVAPTERVHIDFCQFGSKYFCVIKDKASGFLFVRQTRDQTAKTAIEILHKFCTSYGLVSQCTSDDAPAFRNTFSAWCRDRHISHVHSSAYTSSSNGLAEAGVRQLKQILSKEPRLTAPELQDLVFHINNRVQSPTLGSAAMRFFRRGPRTILPNSIQREISHREMVRSRHQKQLQIVDRLGRNSADDFKVGDDVLLQNVQTKKWDIVGTISEARFADDGQTISFFVTTADGAEYLRHKRLIKFNWLSPKYSSSHADNCPPPADTNSSPAGPSEPTSDASHSTTTTTTAAVAPRRSPRFAQNATASTDVVPSNSSRVLGPDPDERLCQLQGKRQGEVPPSLLPEKRQRTV